jgi:hypothetical protein
MASLNHKVDCEVKLGDGETCSNLDQDEKDPCWLVEDVLSQLQGGSLFLVKGKNGKLE